MEVGRLYVARAVGFLAGHLNGVVGHLRKDQVDSLLPPSGLADGISKYWRT